MVRTLHFLSPSLSLSRLSLTLTLGLIGAAGCQGSREETLEARRPPKGSPVAVQPAALPVKPGLTEQLALEAQSRPARAVRPEALFAGLSQRGVTLVRQRQVLGSLLGASYCQTAVSQSGLALSVCEFAGEQDAARGEERSRELFDPLIQGRTLQRNGATLLTLSAGAGPEAATEAAEASALFAALGPSERR